MYYKMNLTKDTYEYILNFATDRDIINMLSSNKKFRNEELFERVMRKRYPLVVRFKEKDMSWKEFFIQTVYYLSKLEENYNLPYLQTLDFDPKHIYTVLLRYPSIKQRTKSIVYLYRNSYNKEYHTIAHLIDDKYVVSPNFIKGRSIGDFFSPNILEKYNEKIIYIIVNGEKKRNNEWVTVELKNGIDTNSSSHPDKHSAELFLFENYRAVIENFIEEVLFHNFNINEEEAILQHSTLDINWKDFKIFQEKLDLHNYPSFYLFTNLPNMNSIRFDFQLIHAHFL